jgi:hypothetical protein
MATVLIPQIKTAIAPAPPTLQAKAPNGPPIRTLSDNFRRSARPNLVNIVFIGLEANHSCGNR